MPILGENGSNWAPFGSFGAKRCHLGWDSPPFLPLFSISSFLAPNSAVLTPNQSKARGRRRRALSPSLLGALGDTVTPMAALWDGDNAGRALLGRVLGCVLPEGGVPM